VSTKFGLILLENELLLSSELLTCIFASAVLPSITLLTLKDLFRHAGYVNSKNILLEEFEDDM